jgi:hypothetical protein
MVAVGTGGIEVKKGHELCAAPVRKFPYIFRKVSIQLVVLRDGPAVA